MSGFRKTAIARCGGRSDLDGFQLLARPDRYRGRDRHPGWWYLMLDPSQRRRLKDIRGAGRSAAEQRGRRRARYLAPRRRSGAGWPCRVTSSSRAPRDRPGITAAGAAFTLTDNPEPGGLPCPCAASTTLSCTSTTWPAPWTSTPPRWDSRSGPRSRARPRSSARPARPTTTTWGCSGSAGPPIPADATPRAGPVPPGLGGGHAGRAGGDPPGARRPWRAGRRQRPPGVQVPVRQGPERDRVRGDVAGAGGRLGDRTPAGRP